jgi:hypothetical protein
VRARGSEKLWWGRMAAVGCIFPQFQAKHAAVCHQLPAAYTATGFACYGPHEALSSGLPLFNCGAPSIFQQFTAGQPATLAGALQYSLHQPVPTGIIEPATAGTMSAVAPQPYYQYAAATGIGAVAGLGATGVPRIAQQFP